MNRHYGVYEDLDVVIEYNGIEGIVSPCGPGWDWIVRPTSSRAEQPETFDSGNHPDRAKAVEAAERSVKQADSHYESQEVVSLYYGLEK